MTTMTGTTVTAEKERAADAIRVLGGIPATDVENVLTDMLNLQASHQRNMDRLANQYPHAVNVDGSVEHGWYHEARASRDALTAPLMALQALVNAARRY